MKIIIVGCPGAGKSVLTRRINEFLSYPVMHLDKVYHTGGKSHITREELIKKVEEFANSHERWIIDGNYVSTLEMRTQLADTIVVLKIPSETCLENAYSREKDYINKGTNREDMAEGFDGTMTEEFVTSIKNFEKDTLPRINEVLKKYKEKNVVFINNYIELEGFVGWLKQEQRK